MASAFPAAVDTLQNNFTNLTLNKNVHPAIHNLNSDGLTAVQNYLINGRGGSYLRIDSDGNLKWVPASASKEVHFASAPYPSDPAGTVRIGNLLPADAGAGDHLAHLKIIDHRSIANADETKLHAALEIIQGHTYGSNTSGASISAADINITVEDDFNHDLPAFYTIAPTFAYNGGGIIDATSGGFASSYALNYYNTGGGTIKYGASMTVVTPLNQYIQSTGIPSVLNNFQGIDIRDLFQHTAVQIGAGGTKALGNYTGWLLALRIRSQRSRTTGDVYDAYIEPPGVGDGIGNTGILIGLGTPDSFTVNLGNTAGTTPLYAGVSIGGQTLTSSAARTVTTAASLFVVGPPVAAGSVTFGGNSPYAFAVGSGKSYFGGAIMLPEITEPAAAPSMPVGHAYIYAKDNGSGKTGVYARFPTGAVQQIALEP